MKKRITSFLLFLAALLTGGFLLSANAAALPTLPDGSTPPTEEIAPAEEEPAETTPVEEVVPEEELPEEATTPAAETTPEEAAPVAETTDETTDEAPEDERDACSQQMGQVGWLVCPATRAIAAVTDAAMGALQWLLRVDVTDEIFDSPLYHVWNYIRGLANVIFVIMFLVVIFSHFTGWNLNAYAMRRAAPKLLLVAVLVNLSFFISVILIDLSNIIGSSLVGVFDNIIANAGANGGAMVTASGWEAVLAVLTGAGVAAGGLIAGLVVSGGFSGIFFLLVPVLLCAVVAVLAAVLTMAARQALIYILVMLSPIAFVSMLLQGTEKLFALWKKMLSQMLILFPMFALLYGASRLAGWAIMVSAGGSMIQVVLGMAVQVVPLVMTPGLLKMSNSVLGKINELARKPFSPVQKAVGQWSADKQALAKAHHLNRGLAGGKAGWAYQPSAKLAAFMAKHKAIGAADLAQTERSTQSRLSSHVDNYTAAFKTKKKTGNNQLKHRLGYVTKQAGVDEMRAQIDKMERESTLNEASGWTDATYKATTGKQRKLAEISARGGEAWYDLYTAEQRQLKNDRADAMARLNRIFDAEEAHERYVMGGQNQHYQKLEGDQAKLDDYKKYVGRIVGTDNRMQTREEKREAKIIRDRAVGDAMKMRDMYNAKTRDAYDVLFQNTAKTYGIQFATRHAMQDNDWERMEAGIINLAKRGDYNLLQEEVINATEKGWLGDKIDSMGHKRLMDSLAGMKREHMTLATYAKAMNIRRGKYGNFEGRINEIMTEHTDWTRDQAIEDYWRDKISKSGDGVAYADVTHEQIRAAHAKLLDATKVISLVDWARPDANGKSNLVDMLADISDPSIAKSQDRTYWESLDDLMYRAGIKPTSTHVGNLVKQIRAATCSGEIDGEVLTNMTKHLLWSYYDDENGVKRKRLNKESIANYFSYMSAGNIKNVKTLQLMMANDALLVDAAETAEEAAALEAGFKDRARGWAVDEMSPELQVFLAQANYRAANTSGGSILADMNPEVVAKFKIADMTEHGGNKFVTSKFFQEQLFSDGGLVSKLSGAQLDTYTQSVTTNAEIAQVGRHRDWVEKLVDYRLRSAGVEGSYEEGKIDQKTQKMFDKLSRSEKANLDSDVREKLGYR